MPSRDRPRKDSQQTLSVRADARRPYRSVRGCWFSVGSNQRIANTRGESIHHRGALLFAFHETVVGEAAVRASSYGELEAAIDDGGASKFLVHQQSSAEASANVLVAVNHFSERRITMTSDDDSRASDGEKTTTTADSGSNGSEGGTTTDVDGGSTDGGSDGNAGEPPSPSLPGFGVGAALVALGVLTVFALRRR